MKIRKGDIVLVIKGKYQGKTGKVLKAIPKERRVVVEGVNIVKKHRRPRKEGEKGEIWETPAPIAVANVKLICKKCKKATRVGYRIEMKKRGEKTKRTKTRICKKCGKPT